MCGLAGAAGLNMVDRDLESLTVAWLMSTSRGLDSHGFFVVRDNHIHVEKGLGIPSQTLVGKKANVVACHTRHATKGDVTLQNAHPFTFVFPEGDEVVGMHNGTLTDYQDIDGSDGYLGTTDSERLIGALADGDAKEVFGKISGAWAAVWYCQKERKLFLCRNSQRPLFWTHASGLFWWASEKAILEYSLRKISGATPKIQELKVDTLFSLDPTKHNPDLVDLGPCVGKKVVHAGWYGGYGKYDGYTNERNYGHATFPRQQTKKTTLPTLPTQGARMNFPFLIDSSKRTHEYMSVSEFLDHGNTCTVCGVEVKPNPLTDYASSAVLDDGSVLCPRHTREFLENKAS